MAEQVGQIFVKLELDDKEFDKGLSQAESKSEKTGGFLKNALSFAAGGLIAKGIETITGSIGGLVGGMIDGNAQFETYTTQFGVLLGSTDEAKKRLAELAKFGATTPFELPELVDADKVLTGFGIHSQDMLSIVGDVSAGTGVAFKDMALLMGKFSAGATGEVISRFAELGITNRKQLAEMGLEFSKSGELLSPLPEAMAVVEQIMKDKFGGMMNAQSMTFEGMVSNLQDWIGSTVRTLGTPIFDVVKDKLGVLLTFLNDPATMASLNAFATSLASGIGFAMDFIANQAIPALITGWTNIQPALTTAMNIFNTLANIVTTYVIPALVTIANFIANNIKPILAGLVAVLVSVVVPAFIAWSAAAAAAAAATVIALAPVLLPLAAIGAAVYLLYQAWDTNFLGIRTTLTDFWNNYGLPIFTVVQEWLVTNLPIAIQGVSDFFNNVLLPALQSIWAFINDYIIPIIVTLIVVNFELLKTAIKQVTDVWNNFLLPAIKAVWNFFDKFLIPLIMAFINVNIALFQLAIREVVTLWKDHLYPALSGVWTFIQGFLMPAIKLLTNAALTPLGDAAKSAGGFFNTVLKPAFDTIVGFIKETMQPVFSALSAVINGVSGAINSVAGAVSSAISALNKLADRIRSMPSIGGIPGFAHGTSFAPGGLALVGEQGPELVSLPRGSRVNTASETASMLNGSGRTQNIYFTANYANTQSESSLMNDVSMLQALLPGL